MAQTAQNKKALLEALEKSLGVVTTACAHTGVARRTFYNWMREDDDFAEKVRELEEVALDFAESQLHKKIKDGDTAATIFYLKTKGKKRGYIERAELDLGLKDVNKIQVEFIPPKILTDRENDERHID